MGVLKKIKDNILSEEKNKSKRLNYDEVSLNSKVESFISWYCENMVKDNYLKSDEGRVINNMRNFIEKMAVWYELRYPDYEVCRVVPSFNQEVTLANDVMFRNNLYVNELLGSDSEAKELDWNDFYNPEVFIEALPISERRLFVKPKYGDLIYIERGRSAHFHLNSDGIVCESEGVANYTNFKVFDAKLVGMHIEEVLRLLKDNNVLLPIGNELEEKIKTIGNYNYQREEMLNCVMYRIIERGGNILGPRRAFLFAKEFRRNIDIPMMYGVDYFDPGLRTFINEYIKSGGNADLMCYVNYFSRESINEKIYTASIRDLLKTVQYDCATKYTPEETEVYQRLVNVLFSQVDQNELKKEKVKQFRAQWELEKGIKNK